MSRVKQGLKDVKWRKIHAPKPWHPKEAGEELVGFYVGRTKKSGSYGQYEVLVIAVPYKGTYTISGTALIQLADSGMVGRGEAVRIVFLGRKDISTESEKREMKLFELYVGEGSTADDLPDDLPDDAPDIAFEGQS